MSKKIRCSRTFCWREATHNIVVRAEDTDYSEKWEYCKKHWEMATKLMREMSIKSHLFPHPPQGRR